MIVDKKSKKLHFIQITLQSGIKGKLETTFFGKKYDSLAEEDKEGEPRKKKPKNQNSKNIAQASGNDSLAEEDKEGEPQASGNVPMTFYTDYKNVIDKFRDYEFIYYLIHGNTSTNYNEKKKDEKDVSEILKNRDLTIVEDLKLKKIQMISIRYLGDLLGSNLMKKIKGESFDIRKMIEKTDEQNFMRYIQILGYKIQSYNFKSLMKKDAINEIIKSSEPLVVWIKDNCHKDDLINSEFMVLIPESGNILIHMIPEIINQDKINQLYKEYLMNCKNDFKKKFENKINFHILNNDYENTIDNIKWSLFKNIKNLYRVCNIDKCTNNRCKCRDNKLQCIEDKCICENCQNR